jgi:F-type H+-transporting ATPase subunit alpha
MTDLINNITADLQKQIDSYEPEVEVTDVGTVLEAGDGIARVDGLSSVRAQELVQFANGVMGIAFNLENDSVGVIIMGEYSAIDEGMTVHSTGRIASVPVGDALVGRVVNALGQPIDRKGAIKTEKYRPIERIAPGVVTRKDVDTPVQTGLISIDAMTPIGRGQRELIIGDRQTGKTAITIDTIINQKGKDLLCIYVAIGQKKAGIARTVDVLTRFGAMDYTTVVVAAADEPAALQYIAPYAGCAMGEEFMETGRDALVVYDDLSKHAWAYRQVSLLLRRPPGREAYPGDVFYLHSRLLERAAKLADNYIIVPKDFSKDEVDPDEVKEKEIFSGPLGEHEAETALEGMENSADYKIGKIKGSGGSLTALPIIETLLGDVSAYIPTNVIGLSVSRVGGDAQTKAMKQVASRLRLDMASFRELAAFAQFGSDLDKATQAQLKRGQQLQEILKQPQYEPESLENQVIILFAGTNGYADELPIERVPAWKESLLRYLETSHVDLVKDIAEKKQVTEETQSSLHEAIKTFNSTWQ